MYSAFASAYLRQSVFAVGFDLERLTARLAAAPSEFLAPTDPRRPGAVHVEAVVADLFRDRASRPLAPGEVDGFRFRAEAKKHLSVVLVAAWLLHDEAFANAPAERLACLLSERLRPLADLVHPRAFLEDPDRREELVRVCLDALGVRPDGEPAAAFEDRLATLDSVRRESLLRDAREREAERERRKKELERLRAQEDEERRKAARTTFED